MFRSIRARLLVALTVVVVALTALGGWSAWRLRDLGRVAERILADNYLSVEAAHAMRVSLERLEAERRMRLAGGVPADDAAADRRQFEHAFDTAEGNITEPGEADVIAAIRAGYARYRAGDAGALVALRQAMDRLDALNTGAMRHKSDAAGALARRDVAWTLALVALLASTGAWLAWGVATSIAGPIEALTRATTRIASGDLEVAVPVGRDDEVGQMARSFNEMAGRLRQAKASDLDAIAQARQVAERAMLLEDVRHLHELNRLKSEFVAEASHELRTPITSLQLGLHLALERPEGLSPRDAGILAMCRDEADRLARLVRELLDLSRLESGTRPPRLMRCGAGPLVRGAVEALRLAVAARGVTLDVEAADDLPDVEVDRAQIERVVSNLVTNAGRATPPGGRVRVTASASADAVTIAVSDTGIGIPADQLVRIFEPFAQVPGGPAGGVGLGLSISRRIVEAHRGRLTVRSAPGAGSTFTCTLPRAGSTRIGGPA
jgi:signal transduction histidine kinase